MIFIQVGSSAKTGGAAQHFLKIRKLARQLETPIFFCDLGTAKENNIVQINVFIPICRLSRRGLFYFFGAALNTIIFAFILLFVRLGVKEHSKVWIHAKELKICRLLAPLVNEKSILLDVRDSKNIPVLSDLRIISSCIYCSDGIYACLKPLPITCFPLTVFFDRQQLENDLARSRVIKFVIPHGIDDSKNSWAISKFLKVYQERHFRLDIYGRVRSSISNSLINDPKIRLKGTVTRSEFLEQAMHRDSFLLLIGESDGLPRSAVEWICAGGFVISTQQIAEMKSLTRFVLANSFEEIFDCVDLHSGDQQIDGPVCKHMDMFFNEKLFAEQFFDVVRHLERVSV